MDGIEVLKRIKRIDPQAMVIIITAYASVESAIAAMKMGAFDYIQKPFKHDDLLMTIDRALEHKRLQDENIRLKDELRQKFGFENIIGKSKADEGRLRARQGRRARPGAPSSSRARAGRARSSSPGPSTSTASGPEFPFIIVNSGSLPPDLLESHLFGHVKGAFTGAVTLKTGLFEAADKGTHLLRRDLLAQPRDPGQAPAGPPGKGVHAARRDEDHQGRRPDHRRHEHGHRGAHPAEGLPQGPLLPAERHQDRAPAPPRPQGGHPPPRQALHRRLQPGKQEGDRGVSEDVFEILDGTHWPGNVRELENLIERAVVLSKSTVITRNSLPPFFLKEEAADDEVPESAEGSLDFKERTQYYQKKIILTALKRTKGVQKKAAQMLGVKPTTLNEMIKRLEIDTDDL